MVTVTPRPTANILVAAMFCAPSCLFVLTTAAFFLDSRLVLVLIVVAFVVAFALAFRQQAKKQEEGVAKAGQTMGLAFAPQDESLGKAEFTRLRYFANPGKKQLFTNVLKGRIAGQEAVVFDYQSYNPGGDSQSRSRRTLVCFRLSRGALPEFVLDPRGPTSRWFTPADLVDFSDQPEFSKKYQACAPDGASVRRLLTGEPASLLLQQKGWHVEGGGEWLLISTSGSGYQRALKPGQYLSFLETTGRLADLLSRAATYWQSAEN